ncbi:MAG: metallophosphoesterase [Oligoflexia bacterium]|nr:metallophosphoesterase [Oligoflexia bacterium]
MSYFFIVFSGILVVSWLYIWKRLVLTSQLPTVWKYAAQSFLVLLLLMQIALPFIYRLKAKGNIEVPNILFWIGYGALGFMVFMVFATIARDVFTFLSLKTYAKDFDPTRRLFLFRSINVVSVTAAVGAAFIGTKTALQGPMLKEVVVPVPGLHPDLDGFTIAQISDLHVGPTIKKFHVQRVVQLVQSAKPDMIAITGDLVDGTPEQLAEDVAPLGELSAPMGKFYVTGNHEYYWDVNAWSAKVKSLGIDQLNNEHRLLNIGQARLMVGGVREYSCARIEPDHVSDPHKAIEGAEHSDFKLLLAHQPRSCYKASEAGFDLMICGHTHNGQFMPWNLITRFAHPYHSGLNRHKDKLWVYVNAATGYWGPPQRLGIPSEVTLIRLKSVQKS